MQILRTLFWVLLAVLAVVFAMNNWRDVRIDLWGGLYVQVRLPILVLATFLLGWLPTFLWYRAIGWRMRSRLTARDRELAELRTPPTEPSTEAPVVSTAPIVHRDPVIPPDPA